MQYIHELGPLFDAVQMQSVFPDGKTFPDCLPKGDLADINRQYQLEKDQPGFDLGTFVLDHFELPKNPATEYHSDSSLSVEQHIATLWNELTRQPDREVSSLLPLPYPYVVPGGRFREVYYWDSYFTMLGLRISGRDDLIQNMVDNFARLIDQVGYIPNGNRAYYVGRSQPPFFALMVKLLAEIKSNEILKNYRPQLEREYQFWMEGADQLSAENLCQRRAVLLPDGTILNRYWDDHNTPRPESYKEDVELAQAVEDAPRMYRHLRAAAESGWDFSSRWFRDGNSFASIHTTDLIPVDLNCLLWNLENTLAEAAEIGNDPAAAKNYQGLAEKRAAAIQRFCWAGDFYFDYDFVAGELTPHQTLAAAFPLFFGLASPAQAEQVATILEEKFLQSGGLSTTLLRTGQQWDAPNGWAPLQWIAFAGLRRYALNDLAGKIRDRWVETNQQVFHETGKMMEKYDVFG
ncbi:MAG: alpha,alpha-trehalase TreF, partial [Saprospiraceae bacterium]